MRPDPPLPKRTLRRRMRRRLTALEPAWRATADAAVAERVLGLPEVEAARRVLACLSFGVEVDTWGLIERLLESGRELFVPRADFQTGRLHVHRYPCELVELPFGLRQPPESAPETPPAEVDSRLDVALIPGLAFDRGCLRLGHGGGFFDRFLARRSFPAVGLAYDLQIVDRLPAEPHDLPMRAVTTEVEVLRAVSPS